MKQAMQFLQGEGVNSEGYTLEQILDLNNEEFEMGHDFIQWLFPTDTPSMFNADSPVLDAEAIAIMRADIDVIIGLEKAYNKFLDFCGIVREDGKLRMGVANMNVWGSFNHNMLRITRVLRSLTILGRNKSAQEFFDFLTTMKDQLSPNSFTHWTNAITEPTPA